MENVSHNTSYSEASPNLNNEDEELERSSGSNSQQFSKESTPEPYQSSPPNQLSQQLKQFQAIFKTVNSISHSHLCQIEMQHAFDQLKLNMYEPAKDSSGEREIESQQEDFLLTNSNKGRKFSNAKVINLNQQFRSEQIHNLLMEDDSRVQSRHQSLKKGSHLDNGTEIRQVNPTFSENLKRQLHQLLRDMPQSQPQIKQGVLSLQRTVEEEVRVLSQGFDELESLKLYLNQKVEAVEQMELENLEKHLMLDHRLRNTEEHKQSIMRGNDQEAQTELSYQQLLEKEMLLLQKEKQLELSKLKEDQAYEQRERLLTRKERDIEIRDRLVEEKRMEYTYKHKELGQRLKSQITWPLVCLENEQKLGEKLSELKLTPELVTGMALERDQHFAKFVEREENKKFLKSLKGELYGKAEGLLKLEYSILQERAKDEIVKSYFEGEISAIELEKAELMKEREKYATVLETERQLEDEKRKLDEKRQEFKLLVDDIKKSFQGLPCNEFGALSPFDFNRDQSKRVSGINGMSRIEGGLNMSVFDSALHKTSNLISSMVTPTKNQGWEHRKKASDFNANLSFIQEQDSQNVSLTQKIEKTLQNFEKLNDSYLSKNQLDIVQKKEQNLEQIKKILKREAYFIDEEKRWLADKKSHLSANKSQTINLCLPRASDSQITSSKIIDSPSKEVPLEEDKREAQMLKQNLQLELEINSQLNDQLNQEIDKVKLENQQLVDLEQEMNQQKLKMLIKFEKIKVLEDFYNKHHKEAPMCLEIEVTDEEMKETIERVQEKEVRSMRDTKERRIIISNKLMVIFRYLLFKRNIQRDNAKKYALLYLRCFVVNKQQKELRKRQLLMLSPQDSTSQLIFNPSQQPLVVLENKFNQNCSWQQVFWQKLSRGQHIQNYRQLDGEQLLVAQQALQREVEQFWQFRCTNILSLMNLHLRRRARLLLAFAFMKYKYQVQKSKVHLMLTHKESAIKAAAKNRRVDYKNSSLGDESHEYIQEIQLLNSSYKDEDSMVAETPQLQAESLRRTANASKLAQNTKGRNNAREQQKFIKTDTLESSPSPAYTGISEIILNQHQQNLKKSTLLTYLLLRKGSYEYERGQYQAFNKWKNLLRDIEIFSIKGELRKLLAEVEGLKFQEQVLKTNFRIQKTELESKISELLAYFLSGQSLQETRSSSGAKIHSHRIMK